MSRIHIFFLSLRFLFSIHYSLFTRAAIFQYLGVLVISSKIENNFFKKKSRRCGFWIIAYPLVFSKQNLHPRKSSLNIFYTSEFKITNLLGAISGTIETELMKKA